ncbi:hypothetical protein [Roseibium sp. M-1]
MDEIIMRRLRHLQRLEENHARVFEERSAKTRDGGNRASEEIADTLSADWNLKQRAERRAAAKKPLPTGWRNEHWKTQQAIATDYAGVQVANKAEAVSALEAYEETLTFSPAA